MHNLAALPVAPATLAPRTVPHPSTVEVRAATIADVPAILDLVNAYAAQGLMLLRTQAQLEAKVDSYLVAVDREGEVLACAALDQYSERLGEVSSVAVSSTAQGRGLGSLVVRGVERMARARGLREIFAMSLSDEFFRSLGYGQTSVSRYPEKIARYEALKAAGHKIVPRRCWRKPLSSRVRKSA